MLAFFCFLFFVLPHYANIKLSQKVCEGKKVLAQYNLT